MDTTSAIKHAGFNEKHDYNSNLEQSSIDQRDYDDDETYSTQSDLSQSSMSDVNEQSSEIEMEENGSWLNECGNDSMSHSSENESENDSMSQSSENESENGSMSNSHGHDSELDDSEIMGIKSYATHTESDDAIVESDDLSEMDNMDDDIVESDPNALCDQLHILFDKHPQIKKVISRLRDLGYIE